jgi:hypothetical protein
MSIAIDGHRAAVHKKLPGRIAARHDNVTGVVTELG